VAAAYAGLSGKQTLHISVPSKPCEYAPATPASLTFDQRGGSGVINLRQTQGTNCAWTASAQGGVDLLDMAGTGDVSARFVVSPYIGTTSCTRTGDIEIRWTAPSGEQTIGVAQRDSGCGALGFSYVRCGSGRPGETVLLACYVVAKLGEDPIASVTADLRAFGGSDRTGLGRCVACGEPGYELDLRIPATMPAGTYSIRFTVTDTKGRTGTGVGMMAVQ